MAVVNAERSDTSRTKTVGNYKAIEGGKQGTEQRWEREGIQGVRIGRFKGMFRL